MWHVYVMILFHLNVESSPESPRITTVTPDEEVTVSCRIGCAGIDWSGCGVQPSAIVIVPSMNYKAHDICFGSPHDNFNQQGYSVTATCDLGGIQRETCTNASDLIYNVTLMGFNASSLREFVIVCGVARNYNNSPPLTVNGLLSRKFVIKVAQEQQLKGKYNYGTLNIHACM